MASSESHKLTLFVDCGLSTSQLPAPSYPLTISSVSPYSWFAFINCTHYREQLKQHGIAVDIVPFFLGGARNGNGHPYQEPPPVKAVWGDRDVQTVASLLGLKTQRPKIFPIISLYPVRALTFIRDHHGQSLFERSAYALWRAYWSEGIDTSTPSGLVEALSTVFPEQTLTQIIEGMVSAENKKRVIDTTNAVMKQGAFGAPWIIATNSRGESANFWGNDRWDHVFLHLGVPFLPVTILPPGTVNMRDAKL